MKIEALQQYGFSNKEAKIYLALLELGQATISDISNITKFPRSSIYTIIEELKQRGVVFEYEHNKIKEFIPQKPQKIISGYAKSFTAF